MGCSNSKSSSSVVPADEQFRKLININDALIKYKSEGIFENKSTSDSIDGIELRILLDDSLALKYITAFSSVYNTLYLLTMWNNLLTYSKMNYSGSSGKRKLDVMCMMCINSAHSVHIQEIYMDHKVTFSDSVATIYDDDTTGMYRMLFISCFESILNEIFLPFKNSPHYVQLNYALNFSSNVVETSDFEYINKIGGGGFGIVLLCKKKSTGIQYAMKVQPKYSMLKMFKGSKLELPLLIDKLTIELKSMQSFDHPYIISLAYAFQSSTLVFLLMPISTCGDLEMSLKLCTAGYMSYDRVKFYAAEIVI